MQRWAVGLATGLLVLGLAVGCGGTKTAETVTVTSAAAPSTGPAAPALQVQYGHIKSLKPSGDHFVMRFDPAWFLSGETANVAAAEDGVVEPGQPVPNDNYVLEEGHRLLTYLVPKGARVTVLARTSSGYEEREISVSELAKIVQGTSNIDLFEPLQSGVWITVRIDTVRSIRQQYRP